MYILASEVTNNDIKQALLGLLIFTCIFLISCVITNICKQFNMIDTLQEKYYKRKKEEKETLKNSIKKEIEKDMKK